MNKRVPHSPQKWRVPLQGPCLWTAENDRHRIGRINQCRGIGRSMDGVTVIAMAIELNERFAGQFNLHLPAAALNATCHLRGSRPCYQN